MQCRSCGAEIADKALICYRCGTATTDAKYKPAAPSRGSRGGLIATVVAVAIIVLVGLFLARSTDTLESSRIVTGVAVAAALIVVVLRAYARRR
jgi:ABC-type uncharacterized transport system permease subunit